jgi:hypothetical protein
VVEVAETEEVIVEVVEAEEVIVEVVEAEEATVEGVVGEEEILLVEVIKKRGKRKELKHVYTL